MAEEHWTKAAEESEVLEGKPVVVAVGDDEIMLVRIDGEIHACGHQCTHYGAPLSEGVVSGHCIVCPWHNARFW